MLEFAFISTPMPLASSPVDKEIERLLRFGRMKEGWDYGRGKRISFAVIIRAMKILAALRYLGASSAEVFPRVGGGVLISAYQGDITVDANLGAEYKVRLEVESGAQELYSEADLDIDQAIAIVRDNEWLSRPISDLSTQRTILVWSSHGSSQALSRSPVTTEQYQSFNNLVLINQASAFASIYQSTTTQTFPVTHPYFTGLEQTDYRIRA